MTPLLVASARDAVEASRRGSSQCPRPRIHHAIQGRVEQVVADDDDPRSPSTSGRWFSARRRTGHPEGMALTEAIQRWIRRSMRSSRPSASCSGKASRQSCSIRSSVALARPSAAFPAIRNASLPKLRGCVVCSRRTRNTRRKRPSSTNQLGCARARKAVRTGEWRAGNELADQNARGVCRWPPATPWNANGSSKGRLEAARARRNRRSPFRECRWRRSPDGICRRKRRHRSNV